MLEASLRTSMLFVAISLPAVEGTSLPPRRRWWPKEPLRSEEKQEKGNSNFAFAAAKGCHLGEGKGGLLLRGGVLPEGCSRGGASFGGGFPNLSMAGLLRQVPGGSSQLQAQGRRHSVLQGTGLPQAFAVSPEQACGVE